MARKICSGTVFQNLELLGARSSQPTCAWRGRNFAWHGRGAKTCLARELLPSRGPGGVLRLFEVLPCLGEKRLKFSAHAPTPMGGGGGAALTPQGSHHAPLAATGKSQAVDPFGFGAPADPPPSSRLLPQPSSHGRRRPRRRHLLHSISGSPLAARRIRRVTGGGSMRIWSTCGSAPSGRILPLCPWRRASTDGPGRPELSW